MQRRITKSYFNYFYKQKYNLLKKIVSGLSKRYDTNSFDDFMAIARNELFYSMVHFDPMLGAFNTFLWHRISGGILHQIDSNIKQIARYQTETKSEFIHAQYNEPVGSGMIVQEMLDSLKEDEAKVLRMRYLENNTLLEITGKTGWSTYKILSLQNEAVGKLQNKFERD